MDKVSDIKKVNKLSRIIYKKSVEPSTRKNKKYMILNDITTNMYISEIVDMRTSLNIKI